MKVIYHAPDSALPKEFSKAQCDAFRAWAHKRLDRVFLDAEVSVVPNEMEESTGQFSVFVEGGTPSIARTVFDVATILLGQFITIEVIEVQPPMVQQTWLGGFYEWTNS